MGLHPVKVEYVWCDGYTPEPNPPEWVSRTIRYYNSKPKKKSSGVINCNSPVNRNKPQCFNN